MNFGPFLLVNNDQSYNRIYSLETKMQNKVTKRAQSSIFYNEMEQIWEKIEELLLSQMVESAKENKSLSKFKILTSILPRS